MLLPLIMHAVSHLRLERLVLMGFGIASLGATQPLLWPDKLLLSNAVDTDQQLNMTDVRLVINDPVVFNQLHAYFLTGSGLVYWTVS